MIGLGIPARIRLGLLGVIVCLLFVVIGSGKVVAHGEFTRSEPSPGVILEELPARVTIWFDEELATGSWIEVAYQRGDRVDNGDIKLPLTDPQAMSVGLRTGTAGTYLVEWATVSLQDGDVQDGDFTFSVGVPGVTGSGGEPSGPGGEAVLTVGRLVLLSIALSATAVLAVAMWALVRKRRAAV